MADKTKKPAAEPAVDTKPNEHVTEYGGIDTRNEDVNLASRSNIVRDDR